MLITVTGATGTIGSELVHLLSGARASTRAIFRDASRTRPLPGVAWTQADLSHADLLDPALAGTARLFLLTDNTAGFGRVQIAILRAAERLGVAYVVKLSALGASDHSKSGIGREHWEVEQELQRTSMRWTILRPHAFMQNWLGDAAQSVQAEGAISSPIEDGRVPFIDARDIAAVAAAALLNPEAHAGRKYVLTGGEAVSYEDVAAALSEATGRPVAYRRITMEEARARLQAGGTPADQIDATLAIAEYQRAGGPTARVSDDVGRILGTPPRTIRDFAKDYAGRFRAGD